MANLQINLLPDLKLEYLKAQRTKYMIMASSAVVIMACIGLLILMYFYVYVWQKEHTNNLRNHIGELTTEYESFDNLEEIITIQNQLSALPGLHNEKPLVSRLTNYLGTITPKDSSYSKVDLDLTLLTIRLEGSAPETSDVNKLTNSIKNAVYVINTDVDTAKSAFSSVRLESINNREDEVLFTVAMTFDPQIFMTREEIALVIPDIDSTNSEVNSPGSDIDKVIQDMFKLEETDPND